MIRGGGRLNRGVVGGLGGLEYGVAFNALSAFAAGPGADERDEVGCVDGASHCSLRHADAGSWEHCRLGTACGKGPFDLGRQGVVPRRKGQLIADEQLALPALGSMPVLRRSAT